MAKKPLYGKVQEYEKNLKVHLLVLDQKRYLLWIKVKGKVDQNNNWDTKDKENEEKKC